jgi:hypothetical protein
MRRLARALFTLCSSVLLVGASAAWIDSRFYTHWLCWNESTWSVSISSGRGGCTVYCVGRITYLPRWTRERWDNASGSVSYDALFDRRHAFGFGLAVAKPLPSRGPAYGFAVPYWFVVGALGLITWRAWPSRSPPRPGLCPACGYDLRASPDYCPECGSPAPAIG